MSVTVRVDGVNKGTRDALNFLNASSNVAVGATDDAGNNEVELTLTSDGKAKAHATGTADYVANLLCPQAGLRKLTDALTSTIKLLLSVRSLADGRLTLTSGAPVTTSDVTAAGSRRAPRTVHDA